MEKEILKEEKEYLNLTKETILARIDNASVVSSELNKSFNQDNENYLKEMRSMNLNDMKDDVEFELDFQQRNLTNMTNAINENDRLIQTYKNMLDNPYFSRIDVKIDEAPEKYYIGVHSLMDKNNNFMIIDWRSPIAGLFYDYEVGPAEIKTSEVKTPCTLLNKRQYKIENGNLEYYFDTNIVIDDEMLKNALAKSSNTKMKTIVQTIQKEQNEIIRCNENQSILVQGIAGSGKTAIALHRIAYLLYKMKNQVTSDNIAMLSPNNAFSTYISSVLPDLAEDDIRKYQLDYILKSELKQFAIVEEKYEQVERILRTDTEEYKYKTSYEYLQKLKEFCEENIINKFDCQDFDYMGLSFNGNVINNLYYKSYAGKDVFTRICWICEHLISEYFYRVTNHFKLKTIKQELFNKLYSMIKTKNCVKLYMQFLNSIGRELTLVNKKVKNEDAYAMFYIRTQVYGAKKFSNIKHLVIDEIQDYSPVQLAIISEMFSCPKTMLGDFRQSLVVKNFASVVKEYKEIFNEELATIVLNKTYRPTVEIADMFNFVGNVVGTDVVSRHGDMPDYFVVDLNAMPNFVVAQVKKLQEKYKSVAIITKTTLQAQQLYSKISGKLDIQLIDDSKDEYSNSICLLSAFSSKGMEFDAVIVYDTSENNYSNETDLNLLYIALSRALHKVECITSKKLNKKLDEYFKHFKKGE